jgi:hypothetical protein
VQQHAEDLALAGALGRAHAAWYEHDEAMRWLERAAEGWLELERAHDASYAVCELLRVASGCGDAARTERALERFAGPVLDDPRTAASARAFLHVAIGRALVLLSDPRRGLSWLEDRAAPFGLAPPHARLAGMRWRAEALSELDREPAARALRDRVAAASGPGEESAIALLARVDRAAREGRAGALMSEVEAHPLLGRELRRLTAHFLPRAQTDAVALLRRHCRY